MLMARNRILIVDDEFAVRFGIREFLELHEYQIEEAETCQDARRIFSTSRPDVVIADYMLPDGTALDLLPRLKEIDSEIPLLVLTAHGSIDLAVRAIKEGAEQFLTKPIELATLHVILQRLLEKQRSHHKQLASKSRQVRQTIDPFIGTSAAIRTLADQARNFLRRSSLAMRRVLLQAPPLRSRDFSKSPIEGQSFLTRLVTSTFKFNQNY